MGSRRRGGFAIFAGDEPRAASAGDEAHRPADEDEDAVLQPDEVVQVHDEVGEPGERPAQLHSSEVYHRPEPADGRDVALVDVTEWPALPPLYPGSDDFG